MKKQKQFLMCLIAGSLFYLLAVSFPVKAEIYGRLNTGLFSFFPAESELQSRMYFTQRIRLGWKPANNGGWSFTSDMRLRKSTEGGSGGPQWQLWNFRMDYGLNRESLAASFGMCYIHSVAGLGSVLGGQIQANPRPGISLGVFAGANPRVIKGRTDTDGIRAGAYVRLGKNALRSGGIGFVYVGNTESSVNLKRSLNFDTRLKLGRSFYFFQSGEIEVPHSGRSANINLYHSNLRFEAARWLRFTLYYSQYSRFLYLQYKNDLEYSGEKIPLPDKANNFTFSSRSISPRVDIRFLHDWRIYLRYRWRRSDHNGLTQWHQYSGGLSCSDLLNSGISMNSRLSWNNRDKKDYLSGYFSLSRDLSRKLSLTLAYAGDKYLYPENIFLSHYVNSTHRLSSAVYLRLSKKISLFLDYERSFGDNADDHQVMMNFQFKFK